MIKVAINGFGRIGRLTFRKLFQDQTIEIVAVNDLTSPNILANLLEFDSTQGSWMRGKVSSDDTSIIVDGKKIKVYAERDPKNLPWKDLAIDLVIESTGLFTKSEGAKQHIIAGAKKVIISAPAKSSDIKAIVYNVNHQEIKAGDVIISAASCTTNCLAPVVKVLDEAFGIEKGYMTTVHSVTNDQRLLDLPHNDLRRSRAAFANIVPTSTGAASAIGLVLPNLKGKLDGISLRVPTISGSLVDLAVELKTNVTAEKINEAMKKAASESFAYNVSPIVSSDIIGESHGSIFDATLTKVLEVNGKQLVKVYSWYDNEMSFVSQMIRTIKYFANI